MYEGVTRHDIVASIFSTKQIFSNVYRMDAPHMSGAFAIGRLFGGQAVSQAFRAIQEIYGKDLVPQTLHYRFIAPGKVTIPLEYVVTEEGKSMRVEVTQAGKLIGSAHCVLGNDTFPSYPLDLDYVPSHEELSSLDELAEAMGDAFPFPPKLLDMLLFNIKPAENASSPQTEIFRNINWFRLKDDCIKYVPANCGLQMVLLLSDFFIMSLAGDIYNTYGYKMEAAASLTHSVRFHKRNEEINPHGWFLYRVECETLGWNRATLRAMIYDEKYEAVITISQEAYCQVKRKDSSKLPVIIDLVAVILTVPLVAFKMDGVIRPQLLENMFRMEKVADKLYRCNPPQMVGALAENRVFGGQVVAQTFRAVQEHLGREVTPTTMHYRFAAPARGNLPLDYQVEEFESAIRVNVFQSGKLVGFANIRISEDQFPSFPLNLDYVAEPENLAGIIEIIKKTELVGATKDLIRKDIIYEIRPVEWGRYPMTEVPRNISWSRIQRDSLDSIPLWCGIQAILLLSDFLIIQVAEDIYWNHGYIMATGASLAHSVRFHKKNHEIDPHGWFLYRVECEFLVEDRCKLIATVYDRQKTAVITVIQEAYTQIVPREKARL